MRQRLMNKSQMEQIQLDSKKNDLKVFKKRRYFVNRQNNN